MKCPTCITGNLNTSGCHQYCDKCNFSQFSINDDYLENCKDILATLVSNTRFNDEMAFGAVLMEHVVHHLPRFSVWLSQVHSGKEEFLDMLLEQVKSRAINLQIDQQVRNEEKDNSLVCQCGGNDFLARTVGEIYCTHCNARYDYEEERGEYTPYFLCQCSGVSYTSLDTKSGMCECDTCGILYLHDPINKLFRMVVIE